MSYITKTVQVRPPRPYTAIAVGRIARYSVGDGAKRDMVLGKVMVNLGYDIECMYSSAKRLYQDMLIAVSEIKDIVRSAILIVRALLASSLIVKLFGFIRTPLNRLLITLEAIDKILDDTLTASDVCADFREIVEILRIYRGEQDGYIIRSTQSQSAGG